MLEASDRRCSQDRSIHVVHIKDREPQAVQKALAASSRNFVGLMRDGRTVLKYPHCKTEDSMDALREEAARYRHIGLHDNLVVFKGLHEDGIMFEYCERGQLEEVIHGQTPLTNRDKIAIGRQIVLCLIHLHKHNFIHCDLNVNNVFVTLAMTVKIGDLQGQLYRSDGTVEMPTMSQENAKSRHPNAGEDEFTPRTDIFALGTLLYHLWHGCPPFPDLNEYEDEDIIQARYRNGDYPIEPQTSGMDGIIYKCWNSKYDHAAEVLRDMENLAGGRETVR